MDCGGLSAVGDFGLPLGVVPTGPVGVGRSIDQTWARGDHAWDGAHSAGAGFSIGDQSSGERGAWCGGSIHGHALCGLVTGQVLWSGTGLGHWVDPGFLLPGWHGVERGLLSREGKRAVERADDHDFDFRGSRDDASADQMVGGQHPQCGGVGTFQVDDSDRALALGGGNCGELTARPHEES